MVSLGIDGLVSGLDTTALITQLMQAEAGPQTLLKKKQSQTTSMVTAYQALNVKVASLATTAATAAKATSWAAFTASSSASSVTATAGAGAQLSSLTFSVDALASNQVSLSQPFRDVSEIFPTIPPSITVKKADGTMTTITPSSGNLADITAAISSATEAGVRATAVKVGDTYRLQLNGTATGTAGGFQVYAGTAADVEAGLVPPLALSSTATAKDAKVTLWPGSAAATQVSSATNSFANVLDGVSFTVSKQETDPVTLTIGRDDAALKALASNLVGSLGVVLSEITSRTTPTTTTDPDGRTVVTGGIFSGDSTVRNLQQQVSSAASFAVDGVSPSDVGIVIGRDGTFTFDEAKFTAALTADPERVQKIVTGLAQRVADVATDASESETGSISLKVIGQQSVVKDLGERITDWDRRLASRKEGLQRTYAALEVSLSGLQSQSSWLSSQIAALPTIS